MKYYIAQNGQPVGPFEVQELLLQGLTVNSQVWNESMSGWMPASQVPELAALLTQNVPPQPQQPQPQYQQPQQYANPLPQHSQYAGVQSASAQQPENRQTNVVGIIGFCLTMMAIVLCWVPVINVSLWLAGLICCIIGVTKRPKALALVGLIISIVFMFVLFAIIAFYAEEFWL